MELNEKIIHDMYIYDLTLIISPVKDLPESIRVTIRNDEYKYTNILFKSDYNVDTPEYLEFAINRIKELYREPKRTCLNCRWHISPEYCEMHHMMLNGRVSPCYLHESED